MSTLREGGAYVAKCRQMLKVKMCVLWSPVLTEMLVCKLLGYLLRGRECFVIAAQRSVKTPLV